MNEAQTVTEDPHAAGDRSQHRTDFEEFVAARSSALWRSAYLLTGDAHKAEDLLQTALVKAWRRWDSISRREAEESYVRAAIATTYTDWWRRRWNGEVPTEDLPDAAAPGGVRPPASPYDETCSPRSPGCRAASARSWCSASSTT
jgi:DNA-directed RNA polymerase specialized sigma24 family protein